MITVAESLASMLAQQAARPATRPAKGNFYASRAWQSLRYKALERANGRCQCCGARPTPGNELHVDHVKPRSLFPELALDIKNLQILCRRCNLGKSNKFSTDWRDGNND
jgi:5-methylcytosine-specific restriction endonuclease McrA